jgi:hypothetical protein
MLFYLEKINITNFEQTLPSGKRIREDGRTHCIFENGTHSNMLKRSVEKILYANGSVVSDTEDQIALEAAVSSNTVVQGDIGTGYIYILKSLSTDPQLLNIQDLYKIGFCKGSVEERIKNAETDPTYLMSPVKVVETYKCFNLNPHKLETMLHSYFGSACLSIDVFDKNGVRHTPREWFIAPLKEIENAVNMVLDGNIVGKHFE